MATEQSSSSSTPRARRTTSSAAAKPTSPRTPRAPRTPRTATTAAADATQIPAQAPEPTAAPTETPAQRRAPIAEVTRPLYAYVGAADLAVEKLRALPSTALKVLPDGAEVRRLSDRFGELTVEAAKVPTQVGTAVLGLQDRATQLYNTWAERGEKRITEIRRNSAAEDAFTRARAASTSARRAAEAATAAGKAAVAHAPLPRRGR